jgi:hypothetical protein
MTISIDVFLTLKKRTQVLKWYAYQCEEAQKLAAISQKFAHCIQPQP